MASSDMVRGAAMPPCSASLATAPDGLAPCRAGRRELSARIPRRLATRLVAPPRRPTIALCGRQTTRFSAAPQPRQDRPLTWMIRLAHQSFPLRSWRARRRGFRVCRRASRTGLAATRSGARRACAGTDRWPPPDISKTTRPTADLAGDDRLVSGSSSRSTSPLSGAGMSSFGPEHDLEVSSMVPSTGSSVTTQAWLPGQASSRPETGSVRRAVGAMV